MKTAGEPVNQSSPPFMSIINITKATVNNYYKLPSTMKVGDTFRENNQNFVAVTDAQAASFEKLIRRQGKDRYLDCFYNHLDYYLAVRFEDLFIGIETDGYAHS